MKLRVPQRRNTGLFSAVPMGRCLSHSGDQALGETSPLTSVRRSDPRQHAGNTIHPNHECKHGTDQDRDMLAAVLSGRLCSLRC
jgi:hypothetical protein